MAASPAAGEAQRPLPTFRDVFHTLPAQDVLQAMLVRDIGHLLLTERGISKAAAALRPEVLARKGMHPSWSWRKALAAEGALFCDLLGDPLIWTPGPNERNACNLLEHSEDASPWLWLSGGTDWQGFQGGFRCVSERGIKPTWVTFRVRVATPELSGAFLTFAGEQHLWGMADPVLVFSYRGDDCTSHKRCFVVQPSPAGAAARSQSHYVRPTREVADDRPYDVALHLDWAAGALSIFVDGERLVDRVPLKAATPIRFAAIYNWRSAARTAFSELMLGSSCPCEALHRSVPRPAGASPLRAACCRRRSAAGAASGASAGLRAAPSAGRAVAGRGPSLLGSSALLAVAAAVAAVALQWASMQ